MEKLKIYLTAVFSICSNNAYVINTLNKMRNLLKLVECMCPTICLFVVVVVVVFNVALVLV